jgi:hypothetical protein
LKTRTHNTSNISIQAKLNSKASYTSFKNKQRLFIHMPLLQDWYIDQYGRAVPLPQAGTSRFFLYHAPALWFLSSANLGLDGRGNAQEMMDRETHSSMLGGEGGTK